MITWIQRTFQHHFRIIFAVLLVLIIISFIFVTNASSGLGRADRHALTREFFGYNLGSPEDQARLFGDANLSIMLQFGYAGFGAEQVQQYAFQRVAALHLAGQLHIPAATTQEIADRIKTLRAFTGEDGQFDAKRYGAFRDSLKTGARFTEADVTRVISDDVRADKAQLLVAGPGYVLDQDVKTQLARTETSWTLGIATVDYASFIPGVTPTNADLTKFFADNAFRYEIGPRVAVSAVKFDANAFLPSVQVTEQEVKAFFDAAPANFQKPANNPQDPKALKPAEAGDYALVRSEVEATLKFERAQRLANKAASDLSLALFEKQIANDPAVIEAFVAARSQKLQPVAPFTREAGPAEFDHSPEVAAEAFKLNSRRFYSDAVSFNQGAVVLLWQETLPSFTPSLPEVSAKVTADYIENEKRKRFVELGRRLKSHIGERVQAGDTFEQAVASAAKAASVKIEAKLLPAFTARAPAMDVDYTIFGTLDRLEKGQVSDMAITQDKGQGLLVYAADKQLPDLSPANLQYAVARGELAGLTARLGASQFINELVSTELKKSEPKVN